MAKIVLDNITGGYDLSKINANFDKIEAEFQNEVLYRDNPEGEPNTMEQDLDANGNSIINASSISAQSISINGQLVVANETFVTPLPDPTGHATKFPQSDGAGVSWQRIEAPDIDFIYAATGSTSRTQQSKNEEAISVLDFGTDYASVQKALDAAIGKTLRFPEGEYVMTDGTPIISSNTRLDFEPGAVLIQPNKGAFAGFAIMPGSINITIENADIRGPYYGTGPTAWVGVTNTVMVNGDTWAGSLKENIGIDIRGRWYQRDILGYDAAQMNALTDTSSRIRILNCRIDGFGQEAILADRVTGLYVEGNSMLFCGRGGLRMYGVLRGFVHRNIVGNMGPGMDGDYPNWNVYGITATRMQGTVAIPDPNLTISRPTQDVTISHNTVYNCTTWKSLDNHGSIDIRFIGNKCLNSYIGLGLDQGGIDADRGIAPAVRNLIQGNVFESTGATYMRAGITAYGNNSTIQACESPVIVGNTFIGYGGGDTDGAISLSNVRNAVISGNTIKNASRCGIAVNQECDTATISNNIIDDPKMYVTVVADALGAGYTQAGTTTCTVVGGGGSGLVVVPIVVGGQVTSYNVVYPGTGYTSAPTVAPVGDGAGATATVTLNSAYGILASTANAKAAITGNTINNRTQATTRGISLTAPAAGYGVEVDHSNLFVGTFGAKVYPSLANEAGGSFGRIPWAMARVTSAGAITSSIGITSVTKTGTGTYEVVLRTAASSISNLIPDASPYATLNVARASATSSSTLTVTTATVGGALADAGFVLTVWNVLP